MKIFRLPDYALVEEDGEYGGFVRWVESDSTGTRVATSCFDGFVRLYDLTAFSVHNASSPQLIAPVSKICPPGGPRPWGLAFSSDGTRLAVGFLFTPKVDVLEVKGNTLEHLYSPDTSGVTGVQEIDFRTVTFSSDGRFLYGGGGYRLKAVRQLRRWTG
jgi:WD40 repeat protein